MVDITRDLWWEARQNHGKRTIGEQVLSTLQTVSLPGRPVKPQFVYRLTGENKVIVIDLNLYRDLANLKAFYEECGIRHIILRLGGPDRFECNSFTLKEDPTFRTFYTQAKQIGYKSIGGYVVYSAMIDEQNYEASEELLAFAHDVMGQDYKVDYLAADDEVDTWYNGTRLITVTPTNQVWGVRVLLTKIWSKLHLTPVHYSGRWFINRYLAQYTPMFDNFNQGFDVANPNSVYNKQVLNWWAWYLVAINNSNKSYATAQELVNDLPIYTAAQESAYLNVGSHSLYDAHQLAGNWVTPYCLNSVTKEPIGVDVSVLRYDEATWMKMIGKEEAPPPPPPDEPPAPDDGELAQRVTALETKQAAIEARLNGAKVTIEI